MDWAGRSLTAVCMWVSNNTNLSQVCLTCSEAFGFLFGFRAGLYTGLIPANVKFPAGSGDLFRCQAELSSSNSYGCSNCRLLFNKSSPVTALMFTHTFRMTTSKYLVDSRRACFHPLGAKCLLTNKSLSPEWNNISLLRVWVTSLAAEIRGLFWKKVCVHEFFVKEVVWVLRRVTRGCLFTSKQTDNKPSAMPHIWTLCHECMFILLC